MLLWLSGQSGRFWCHRSAVHIEKLAKFCDEQIYCPLLKTTTKVKKKGWPIKNCLIFVGSFYKTLVRGD